MTRQPEPPLHIPDLRYTSALVGPIMRFRGQNMPVPEAPPRDTTDPRFSRCTDHHLACHCREAETSEQLTEYRHERAEVQNILRGMIYGHPTWVMQGNKDRPDLQCRCNGCQVARAMRWSFPFYENTVEIPREPRPQWGPNDLPF